MKVKNKALVVIDLQNDITKNFMYYADKGCEVLQLEECMKAKED